MNTYIKSVLLSMRATNVPTSKLGTWEILKNPISENPLWEYQTCLTKRTVETINSKMGNCIMTDTPDELSKHLEFVLCARGDVLITGLGLGCVVRGLLYRGCVKSITVVERESFVLDNVATYIEDVPGIKTSYIKSDALDWILNTDRRYDYAWHDLWSDPDREEPHLQITHAMLFMSLRDRVERQGAWAFPREYKKLLTKMGNGIKRKKGA